MQPIIPPIDKKLLLGELTNDKLLRKSHKGNNEIYLFTSSDSPNLIKELGRLREITFRNAGGGTGKDCDVDEFDVDPKTPYGQLIVWSPSMQEIMGGYRFILCKDICDNPEEKLATGHIFNFSDKFKKEYMPYTMELGRSFIQPDFQYSLNHLRGLYALDNLWDGICAVASEFNIKYMFGKFTMYKHYNVVARNYILSFLHLYFPDREGLVTPKDPIDYDFEINRTIFDGNDFKKDYKKLKSLLSILDSRIPPLVNSYMNLSETMKIFGTCDNDAFGDTEETGLLISVDDIYPDKIERHLKTYTSTIDVADVYYRRK